MGSLLLVGLSRSIVLVLLGLVLEGVDTGLGTARLLVVLGGSTATETRTYRLPMPTLESLATSLLASLEASWVVPWILSVMKVSHGAERGDGRGGQVVPET